MIPAPYITCDIPNCQAVYATTDEPQEGVGFVEFLLYLAAAAGWSVQNEDRGPHHCPDHVNPSEVTS